MLVLPAPSSCSLAAARMGWPLQDVVTLSVVARPIAALNAQLSSGVRLLVLSNDGQSPAAIAALLRERGFVVHCCAVAHPRLLPELDRYREELAREGLPLQFSFFAGEHGGRPYPQSYTPEEIDRIRRPPLLPGVLQKSLQEYVPRKYDLPELDDDLYDVLRSPRGKLCNAGFNAAFVASDGAVWRCLRIRDSLGRIDGDLRFEAEPCICQEEFCECPLKSYDLYLRDLAADEHVRRVAPRPPRG